MSVNSRDHIVTERLRIVPTFILGTRKERLENDSLQISHLLSLEEANPFRMDCVFIGRF